MSIQSDRNVYIIVHGQRQHFDKVKDKLALKGFKREKMQMASLEKAGTPGEYVAMIWPPMAPKEIVLYQITETASADDKKNLQGMGAWSTVGRKEIQRDPL